MFEQLRRRLTLVCTAVTSIILIGMAAGSFAVSAAQLRARDDKLFLSDLNAVFYHLASQNVIGHTWYTQTESNTGMLLYIEDGGKPLLYNDAWDDGLHASLSARAKAESMRLFGFDASKPPQMRVRPCSRPMPCGGFIRTDSGRLAVTIGGQAAYSRTNSAPSSRRDLRGADRGGNFAAVAVRTVFHSARHSPNRCQPAAPG